MSQMFVSRYKARLLAIVLLQLAAAAACGQGMGSSTGSAREGIYDAEHRPITAGGIEKTGPAMYQDVTAPSGLSTFHHVAGTPKRKYILESIGSGVALLDYDRDGWLDIYLVNGSTFDAEAGREQPPQAALFHNNHDGTFTDVTKSAGVTNLRWGSGAVAADYDNDGWLDLFVSNYGKSRLYHNNHDGPLPMSRRKRMSPSTVGPRERHGGIMTAMDSSISTCLAMCISISQARVLRPPQTVPFAICT